MTVYQLSQLSNHCETADSTILIIFKQTIYVYKAVTPLGLEPPFHGPVKYCDFPTLEQLFSCNLW